MRTLRWLCLPIIVATAILTTVVEADSPHPRAINRKIVKVKEWTLKGKLYSHNDAAEVAAVDVVTFGSTVLPEQLYFYRYFSVHNIPLDYREDYYNILSWLLNSLAGFGLGTPQDNIIKPAWGGPDNILIRVNLWDYGIDPKVFDKLALTQPYFLQPGDRTVVTTLEDGTIIKSEPKKVLFQAGWLNNFAISTLVEKLQTRTPLVRADWFIRNAVLDPNYRNLLGIKTLDDFKNLAAFDKRAERRKEIKASIVISGSDGLCPRVATNNRILARTPTFQGAFWETFDFRTSIGAQNVINNIAAFVRNKTADKIRDAAEYIGVLPNGLQFYAITDEKNVLLDKGDNEIVGDSMGFDFVVRNSRSCMWCHSGGINPFKSQFQRQIGNRIDQADLGVFLADKKGTQIDPIQSLAFRDELRRVFGAANWDKVVKDDSAAYAEAVKAANGLEATTNGLLFRDLWEKYDVDRIDRQHLVFEIGLTEPELDFVLGLRLNGRSNGVLVNALLKPPYHIRRDQFEEGFWELALLSQVLKPANPPPPQVPAPPPRASKKRY